MYDQCVMFDFTSLGQEKRIESSDTSAGYNQTKLLTGNIDASSRCCSTVISQINCLHSYLSAWELLAAIHLYSNFFGRCSHDSTIYYIVYFDSRPLNIYIFLIFTLVIYVLETIHICLVQKNNSHMNIKLIHHLVRF